MKILDKLGLVLFSVIILILSILVCLVNFGLIGIDTLALLSNQILADTLARNVSLALAVIFILLAIRCIFFSSSSKDSSDGILLQNGNGKLLITKETLENLVKNVTSGFVGIDHSNCKILLDKENDVLVYVTIFVKEDVVIKEISNNLQTKIKQTIKKTSDLDVKEVNIKVKDIEASNKIVSDKKEA